MTNEHRRFRPLPKSAFAYIYLVCGHITHPEEQEFYSIWKPKRGLYYCEKCEEWVTKREQTIPGKVERTRRLPEGPENRADDRPMPLGLW